MSVPVPAPIRGDDCNEGRRRCGKDVDGRRCVPVFGCCGTEGDEDPGVGRLLDI